MSYQSKEKYGTFESNCSTCKHGTVHPEDQPCKDCVSHSKFVPIQKEKDMGAIPIYGETAYGVLANQEHDVQQYPAEVKEQKDIKDSGQRTEFKTGAVRDAQGGKGRFDLLPKMAIWALAHHYEKGCQKYGDRNWEKGIPIKNFLDSAQRHTTEFELGFEDENHLIAAIWNLMCAYETLLRIKLGVLPKSLDDLPYPLRGKVENTEDLNTWSMMKKS